MSNSKSNKFSNLNNQISKINNKIKKSRNNQKRLRNNTRTLISTKKYSQLSPRSKLKAKQNLIKKQMLNTKIQNLEGQLINMKRIRNTLKKTTKINNSLKKKNNTKQLPSNISTNNSRKSKSMTGRLSKGLSKMFKKSNNKYIA
jgi:hypothetical protein